jgi:predicted HicB family RNase H-like nuclease
MDKLSYKGYTGSISFSPEDNVYFGEIEGIDALVNYEGDNMDELRIAFREAVDDYITYCQEEGIAIARKGKRESLHDATTNYWAPAIS